MKRRFLTGAIALMLMSAHAQTQTRKIDMQTGTDDDPNNMFTNPSYPYLQVGSYDDIWKVLKPGGNTYVNAYVTTGVVAAYAGPPNPSGIDNYVRVIAPNIAGNGDIATANPPGQYIYRMQFNVHKSCSTITAARLVIDAGTLNSTKGVLTGDGITGFKINGYTVPLPSYTPYDYLEYNNCLVHGPVPPVTIPINPGLLANGLNSFYVIVNTSGGSVNNNTHTALLLVDARIELDYTLGGSNPGFFNMNGSSTFLCQGSNGALNVSLNVTNPSGYNLSINPGNISVSGSGSQQSFPISPSASTNYVLTITSPPTADEPAGCVTTLNWPVTVDPQPINNSQASMCQNSTGYLVFDGAQGGQITVTDPSLIYSGPMPANGQIPVNPSSTTNYVVTITSLSGCMWTYYCTMVVVPPPCNPPPRPGAATGIEQYNTANSDIIVSPNPGRGLFVIQTNGLAGSVTVRDISGKIIKQIEVKNTGKEYSIDLSDHSRGIYLLNLDGDNIHLSRKIVLE